MNDTTAEITNQLKRIIGRWTGTGTARFPTTPTFSYREELVFQLHETQPILHYEQRTWKQMPDSVYQPSHWETGFWRFVSAEAVEIYNAQSSGRVEVSRGTAVITEDGFILRLESVLIANDPRVQQTRRAIELQGERLHYSMDMGTTAVPTLTAHLQAELQRSSD